MAEIKLTGIDRAALARVKEEIERRKAAEEARLREFRSGRIGSRADGGPPLINPARDRELREKLRGRGSEATTPAVSETTARQATAEGRAKTSGPEGFGTGRTTDMPRRPGGVEGFGGSRFRG